MDPFVPTGDTLEAANPTYRDRLKQKMLYNKDGDMRGIFNALGMDNYQARAFSESLFGGGPKAGGTGILDFTGLSVPFGFQEGTRTAVRGYKTGSKVTMGLGALEAALGVAEAVPGAVIATRPLRTAVKTAVKAASGNVSDAAFDEGRRNFLKNSAATAGIAAIAPDVLRGVTRTTGEIVPEVARATSSLDVSVAKINDLLKQKDLLSRQADELRAVEGPNGLPKSQSGSKAVKKDMESFQVQDEIEEAARKALDDLSPTDLSNAADDSIEMIAEQFSISEVLQYDRDRPAFDELMEQVRLRGMHTAKDSKGIDKFPYARNVYEDYYDPINVGEATISRSVFGGPQSLNMVEGGPPFNKQNIMDLEQKMIAEGQSSSEIDVMKARLRQKIYKTQGSAPDEEIIEVFHATPNAPFEKLDSNMSDLNKDGAFGPGDYFSLDSRYPSQFVGGRGSLLSAKVDVSRMLDARLGGKPFTSEQTKGLIEALSRRTDLDGKNLTVVKKDDVLSVSYVRRPLYSGEPLADRRLVQRIPLRNAEEAFKKIKEITNNIKNPLQKDADGYVLARNSPTNTENLKDVLSESGFTGVVGVQEASSGGKSNLVVFDNSVYKDGGRLNTVIDQGVIPEDIGFSASRFADEYTTRNDAKIVEDYRRRLENENISSPEDIELLVQNFARQRSQKYADGGAVMQGVGSLNETARGMSRGPRGIGAYQQYAEGGNVVGEKTGEQTSAGREIYLTPDGERVSEQSLTFEIDGIFVNVPSIHDGVRYNSDQVKEMLMNGEIQPTSAHKTEKEAISAAIARSDSLRGIGSFQPFAGGGPVYANAANR